MLIGKNEKNLKNKSKAKNYKHYSYEYTIKAITPLRVTAIFIRWARHSLTVDPLFF